MCPEEPVCPRVLDGTHRVDDGTHKRDLLKTVLERLERFVNNIIARNIFNTSTFFLRTNPGLPRGRGVFFRCYRVGHAKTATCSRAGLSVRQKRYSLSDINEITRYRKRSFYGIESRQKKNDYFPDIEHASTGRKRKRKLLSAASSSSRACAL